MSFPASTAAQHGGLCHSREKTRLKVPEPPARDHACSETFAIQSIFDAAPALRSLMSDTSQADGDGRCMPVDLALMQMFFCRKFAADFHRDADPIAGGMTRRQLPCRSNAWCGRGLQNSFRDTGNALRGIPTT